MSELRAALRSLYRMMPLILLVAFVVGINVYLFRQDVSEVYESRSRYFVSPVTEIQRGEIGDLVDALNTLDREVMTVSVAEIIGSDVMLEQAAGESDGFDTTGYSVTARRVPSSLAIEVYVQGPSPDGARSIAEGISVEANALLRDLIGAYEIQPLDVPSTPTEPISPRPLQDALFAASVAVIGLSLIRLVTAPRDESELRRSMWVRLRDAARRGWSNRYPIPSWRTLVSEASEFTDSGDRPADAPSDRSATGEALPDDPGRDELEPGAPSTASAEPLTVTDMRSVSPSGG